MKSFTNGDGLKSKDLSTYIKNNVVYEKDKIFTLSIKALLNLGIVKH